MTDDLVLEGECRSLTRLAPTTRRRLEKQGRFPKRIKIGSDAQNGRIAWSRTELENWRSARMAARSK